MVIVYNLLVLMSMILLRFLTGSQKNFIHVRMRVYVCVRSVLHNQYIYAYKLTPWLASINAGTLCISTFRHKSRWQAELE
jgi:hypothetical protein